MLHKDEIAMASILYNIQIHSGMTAVSSNSQKAQQLPVCQSGQPEKPDWTNFASSKQADIQVVSSFRSEASAEALSADRTLDFRRILARGSEVKPYHRKAGPFSTSLRFRPGLGQQTRYPFKTSLASDAGLRNSAVRGQAGAPRAGTDRQVAQE